MQKVTFTHSAWFGLCPIIMTNPDNDGPVVSERYPYTEWLFTLSEYMYRMCFWVAEAMNPEFEPAWPFSRIKKLDKPVTEEFEDE